MDSYTEKSSDLHELFLHHLREMIERLWAGKKKELVAYLERWQFDLRGTDNE